MGCLAAAAIVALLLTGGLKAAGKNSKSYIFVGALLAGTIIVPASLAWWFAKNNVLGDAWYGILTYNSVPGLGRLHTPRAVRVGVLEMAGAVAALIALSAWIARQWIAPERRLSYHLLFLGSGFYGALIFTLWPLLDAEHLIAYYALFVTGLMPLAVGALTRFSQSRNAVWPYALPAAAAFAIMAVEAWTVRVDYVSGFSTQIANLLRLSNPTDYVMDLKGETIFRPRPCNYLFEGVGIARAQRGLMPDDIPERMMATKTCITVRHNYRFVSPRTLAFMDQNNIRVGSYRVLGHAMKPTTEQSTYTFEVVIPETFAFVSGGKAIRGTIDGRPCEGFATVSAGVHTFITNRPCSEVRFVWKQAIDRGFFPSKIDRDVSSKDLSKSAKQST
jgi:hypothetical protein